MFDRDTKDKSLTMDHISTYSRYAILLNYAGKVRCMKCFLFVAIGLFVLISLPANLLAQNDLESMGLIDSVKSLREITYSTSEGAAVSHGRIITSDRLITFDPDGNILETLNYRKGRLYSTIVYEYDTTGRNTGFRKYDAQNRLYLVVNFKYDEDGRLTEEIYDRSFQKAFDDLGNEIDEEYDEYYRNLFVTVQYEYNLLGLVIRKNFLKPDGTPDFVHEFDYSIKRFVSRKTYINEKGDVSWYEKNINDLMGRPVKVKRFANNRLVSTTDITYETDSRSNWVTRQEVTETPGNIYGDPPKKTSENTIRDIEYY